MPTMVAQQRVCAQLASVFSRHGAVEMRLPMLWFKQAAAPDSACPPHYLLDSHGHLIVLPHAGSRLPLCRYVAVQTPLATLKSFSVCLGHHEALPMRTLPDSAAFGSWVAPAQSRLNQGGDGVRVSGPSICPAGQEQTLCGR